MDEITHPPHASMAGMDPYGPCGIMVWSICYKVGITSKVLELAHTRVHFGGRRRDNIPILDFRSGIQPTTTRRGSPWQNIYQRRLGRVSISDLGCDWTEITTKS